MEYSDQNADAVGVSPNIVFSSLQAVEETEELNRRGDNGLLCH